MTQLIGIGASRSCFGAFKLHIANVPLLNRSGLLRTTFGIDAALSKQRAKANDLLNEISFAIAFALNGSHAGGRQDQLRVCRDHSCPPIAAPSHKAAEINV